jgi:hypothetical protein
MKRADTQKLHDAGLITEEQPRKMIEHFQLKEDGSAVIMAQSRNERSRQR